MKRIYAILIIVLIILHPMNYAFQILNNLSKWYYPYSDAQNTSYYNYELLYPVLPSDVILSGNFVFPNHRLFFENYKNIRQFAYIDSKIINNKFQLSVKPTCLPFNAKRAYGVVFDCTYKTNNYNLVIQYDRFGNLTNRFITSKNHLVGLPIVYANDYIEKDRYIFELFNEQGSLWSITRDNDFDQIVALTDELVQIDSTIRNISDGSRFPQNEFGLTDGSIVTTPKQENGKFYTDVYRLQDGKHIGRVNGQCYKINDSYFDCFEKFESPDDSGQILRYDKNILDLVDKFAFLGFIANNNIKIKLSLLDSWDYFTLCASYKGEKTDLYIISLIDNEVLLHRETTIENSMYAWINNGIAYIQSIYGVEAFALETKNSRQNAKQIPFGKYTYFPWVEKSIVKSDTDELICLKPVINKSFFNKTLRSYPIDFDKDIIASNTINIDKYDFFTNDPNNFLYRCNFTQNQYAFINYNENQIKVEQYNIGQSKPIIVSSCKLDNTYLQMSQPLAFDGQIIAAFTKKKGNSLVTSVIVYGDSKILEEYEFPSVNLDIKNTILAANKEYIVLHINKNIVYFDRLSKQASNCKISEKYNNTIPIISGNYAILFEKDKRAMVLNFKTGELSSYQNFMGISNNKIYFLDYDTASNACRLVKFDNKNANIETNNIEYDLNEICSPFVSSCKNALLSEKAIFSTDGLFIQKMPEISEKYHFNKNSLLSTNKGSIYKYDPCLTFSIKKIGSDDEKIYFEIKQTRKDLHSKDKKLMGKIYLSQWENSLKAPIFSSLETAFTEFEINTKQFVFSIEKTKITDCFALIIESNGLLDTKNSELSDFDKEGRPLFDGVPTSLEKQQAIVVTVWKK